MSTLGYKHTEETKQKMREAALERDGDENPEMKQALEFTAANRGAILGALVAVAGVPPAAGSVAIRFPEWERLVSGPLMALTNPNLLKATATASETTEGNWHSEELEEVLICLHRLQQTTSDGMVRSGQMLEDERCRLALEALCPRREQGQPLRPAVVGIVLRKHRGRKVGGLKLILGTVRDKANSKDVPAYRVEGDAPEDTSPLPLM